MESGDAALDHEWGVDGKCINDGCNEVMPTEPSEPVVQTVTMSICANQGTTLSGNSISWSDGDVRFINDKANSSTAIRTSDSDHYRLYAKSNATVSVANGKITKVVFTCTSSAYATVLKNSIGNKATVSGSVVTVTLDGDADELTFTLTAQSRINKIEVTYTES